MEQAVGTLVGENATATSKYSFRWVALGRLGIDGSLRLNLFLPQSSDARQVTQGRNSNAENRTSEAEPGRNFPPFRLHPRVFPRDYRGNRWLWPLDASLVRSTRPILPAL